MSSTILTAAQQRGLLRLGDVIIPGDDLLPSFSASGVADEVDRMLGWMYDSDRSAIQAVLAICAVLPTPAIRGVVTLTERADSAPEPAAAALRMASFGIKGLIVSLYYSGLDRGDRIRPAIGWDTTIVMRPDEPDRHLAATAAPPPAGTGVVSEHTDEPTRPATEEDRA